MASKLESDPSSGSSTPGVEETGRTADGDVFTVPESHDMLHTLLDPRVPKTAADRITVALLVLNFYVFWLLPSHWRAPVFFVLFAAWRTAYNAGLGFLLRQQSERQLLTRWAKREKLFEPPKPGTTGTFLQRVAVHETRPRLRERYDTVPTEYKTWILFRHIVDLVLMQDFVTYCLLGIACFHRTGYPWYVVVGQWSAGLALIVFNLWVKIDAHRVVKDYAWFWGDFFFLKDAHLVFDGVFEMAPHPMYTIGYAAYYGLSLLTASPLLFTASILAHGAQFAFLCLVENPHIDKTYPSDTSEVADEETGEIHVRAMLLFKNFNFTRPSDVQLVVLATTTAILYAFPASQLATALTFGLALFWRTLHTVGLGLLLRKQGETRLWTRLFLKYGKTRQEAYQRWQALYNTSTVMSYVSLMVLVAREFSPFNPEVAYWPFRYIVGAMLMALQAWASTSVWDALGEYGWFYGDFFLPARHRRLSASGIYRYLNHPERLVGIAGVWGAALMTCSAPVTVAAFVWTFYSLGFIQYVEKPHMEQVYGAASVNRRSGVSRNLRKAQPLWLEEFLVKLWSRFVVARLETLEELRPRVEGVVDDTKQALRRYSKAVPSAVVRRLDRVDRHGAWTEVDKRVYSLGEPVHVAWRLPKTAVDKRNWVALYSLSDAPGPNDITRISSAGRWTATDATGYPDHAHVAKPPTLTKTAVEGDVVFAEDALFWAPGKYEARLHWAGGHNVLAVSSPFEIKVDRRSPESASATELAELAATVGYDPTAPQRSNLARFTRAISIVYDIDLAPFVVGLDGPLEKVAERIVATANALNF